jgi:hypothetical protein
VRLPLLLRVLLRTLSTTSCKGVRIMGKAFTFDLYYSISSVSSLEDLVIRDHFSDVQ